MVAQNDQNGSIILHNLLSTIHTNAGTQNICVTKPQKYILLKLMKILYNNSQPLLPGTL